jgi:hypothetical protein
MNLHLPSAITITALVSCLHMWLSLNRTPASRPARRAVASEWVQNGMRGPPTGSANLAMDKSPVERGTTRVYFNTLARGVYSLQFPPVDIDGLMCADANNTQTPLAIPWFPSSGPMVRLWTRGECRRGS